MVRQTHYKVINTYSDKHASILLVGATAAKESDDKQYRADSDHDESSSVELTVEECQVVGIVRLDQTSDYDQRQTD